MFYNISVKNALKFSYDGKAKIYDIRTEEEYQKGHLPTAEWIAENHLMKIFEQEAKLMIILYCNYGNYSLKVARDLSETGYEVYSIVGGYHAYEGYVEKKER